MKKTLLIVLLSSFSTLLIVGIILTIFYFRPPVGVVYYVCKECDQRLLSKPTEKNFSYRPPSYVFITTVNTELFESLGLPYKNSKSFTASVLYDLGVQEIVDISFEKIGNEHHVQIRDSENNDYFFTLNEEGRLWTVRKGDENGEVIWQWEAD